VRTAKRVHGILEDKRDVLINRLNQLIEEAEALRSRAIEELTEAYDDLLGAYVELGPQTIESIARSVPETVDISVESYTMMGMSLVTLEVSGGDSKLPYGFGDTSLALDEAVRKIRRVVADICRAAAVENNIYRVASELRKTQRLLNALEHVIIPRYEEAIRVISATLEENDREYFVKLKHIKRVLERRRAS
jgi:V/A-type H+-transporting ATPase subunit D